MKKVFAKEADHEREAATRYKKERSEGVVKQRKAKE